MNLLLYLTIFVLLQIFINCVVSGEDEDFENNECEIDINENDIQDYNLPICINKRRCMKAILNHLHKETNDEFLNSKRTNIFKQIINDKRSLKNSQVLGIFNLYYIYAIFDSSMISQIAEFFPKKINNNENLLNLYNNEILKQIEYSFTYIGSGQHNRAQQHLFFSKSLCPDSNSFYVNNRVSTSTMFICSQVYGRSNDATQIKPISDVFVHPLMAVKSIKAARKIEYAIIHVLNDLLINIDEGNERYFDKEVNHFLGHYAIEFALRFLPNDLHNSKYKFDNIPTFEIHNTFTYGCYEEDSTPKKFILQNSFFHQYPIDTYFLNGKLIEVSPFVNLPFTKPVFDYKLKKNDVIKIKAIIDNLMEIKFKPNILEVYNCYNLEKNNMPDTNSLKELICIIYIRLIACSKHPTIQNLDKNQLNVNNLFLRKLQVNFEFRLLFSLYIYSNQQQQFYTNWDNFSILPDRLDLVFSKDVSFDTNFIAKFILENTEEFDFYDEDFNEKEENELNLSEKEIENLIENESMETE